MKNGFHLVLILAALLCLAGWTASAQYTRIVPRQAWEYRQVNFDGNFDMTSRLNHLGNEGWQLVAVTSSCPSLSQISPGCKIAYLKREK